MLLLFLCNPASSGLFPPCPFHWLTGLHCPGCGALRALHNLMHGNIAAALALNPLMVISLPVLGAMAMRPAWFRKPWVAWFTFALLISYGLVRNIPAWPFTMLAPH